MDNNFDNENLPLEGFEKEASENEKVLEEIKKEAQNVADVTEKVSEPVSEPQPRPISEPQSAPQPAPQSAPQPIPQPRPQTSAPFMNPNNANGPQVSFSGTGNGYTPYGYYQARPEAKKSKSKGKKLGALIAIVIISISLLFCSVVAVAVVTKSVVGKNIPNITKKEKVEKEENKETVSAEIPLQDNKDIDVDDDDYSASAIYKKVCESNVGILVYYANQSTIYSEGSGVILPTSFADGKNDKMTYIVTCAHVLEQSSAYKTVVQTNDGTQYDAKIVGIDKKTDIGVIAIKETGLKSAQFASSENIAVGETVYALGNPGGSTFFGSFTNGMVSAIGRPVDSPVGYEVACIQHTAPINPGNSGGALLNKYGQVIGINSSKIASNSFEGMGFAVPSETVKEIVEMLISNGYVKGRPVLGITLYPTTYSQVHSVIVKTQNLPAGSIIINSISPTSDLINKDVKKGDMIIAFNGKDLDDYNDLLEFVENSKVGDKITLTICRIDQNYQTTTFDVEVKLVEDTGETYEQEETTQPTFQNPFGFNFGE